MNFVDNQLGAVVAKRQAILKATAAGIAKKAAAKKAALVRVARERAAAKLAAHKKAAAAAKARGAINQVNIGTAQRMLANGGTLVSAPAGVRASKGDAWVLYNGTIYRTSWKIALPQKATAQRAADVRADAAWAVAQGATPEAAAASAVAADYQAYPGSPLVAGPAQVPELMQASQPAYQELMAQPSMLAQQPQAYQHAQDVIQYQPPAAEAAQGDLADEDYYRDVETQAAATAVEAEGSLQAGRFIAAQAPAPAEETAGEVASAAEEAVSADEYQLISPEEEGQMFQQAQEEQISAAREAAISGAKRDAGFFGLGAAEQAKRAGKRAAIRAAQRGATPARAVAVGRKVAASFFRCVRGYHTPMLRHGVMRVSG